MTVWCDEPCDGGEPQPQTVPPGGDGLRQIPNGLGDVDDVDVRMEGVL